VRHDELHDLPSLILEDESESDSEEEIDDTRTDWAFAPSPEAEPPVKAAESVPQSQFGEPPQSPQFRRERTSSREAAILLSGAPSAPQKVAHGDATLAFSTPDPGALLYSQLRGTVVPKECGAEGACLYQSFSDQLLALRGEPRTQRHIDVETARVRDITCTYIMAQPSKDWIQWGDLTREAACELVLRNDGWTAATPFADHICYYVCLALASPVLIFDDDTRTARVCGSVHASVALSAPKICLVRGRNHYRSNESGAQVHSRVFACVCVSACVCVCVCVCVLYVFSCTHLSQCGSYANSRSGECGCYNPRLVSP
jgi:hypothetical protein